MFAPTLTVLPAGLAVSPALLHGAAGGGAATGTSFEKSVVQYQPGVVIPAVGSVLWTRAMPIDLKLALSMLALWPGEFFQPSNTEAAVLYQAARFSDQAKAPTF